MSNYKFLIFGSKGMLGSSIVNVLKKKKISYLTSARNNSNFNMDIKSPHLLKKIFDKNKFKIVVNCAAKIDINYCEKNYSEAKKINSDFVKSLCLLSKKHKFKLVQISTDHVYKGKKLLLNNEKSVVFAINKYAKTKILAENHLKKLNNYLIIRTNFTGKGKNSFIDWLIKNIKKRKTINLFHDMYTSTLDVKTCSKLIIELSNMNSKGTFNLGTRDMISKKEFAIKLGKFYKKKFPYNSESCNIMSVPRGKNLGLDVNKIEKKLNKRMISSNQSIKNILREYI